MRAPIATAAIAAAALLTPIARAQSHTYDPFSLIPVRGTLSSHQLGPASAGSYDAYSVSVDWQAFIGDPWSREAQFALASSADPTDPNLVVYKVLDAPDRGRADNARNDASALTLQWSGDLLTPYEGGDLWFLARQTLNGSQALWLNVSVTLTGLAPPPPPAIDLGIVGGVGEAIEVSTLGSAFDTELGLYDAAGRLLFADDDSGAGTTSAIAIGAGLAEGTYYVALGGQGTEFGVDGFRAIPDLGSEGGAFELAVIGQHGLLEASGLLDEGSVRWFSFRVVPAPSTAGLLALGVTRFGRRRRRVG